MGQAEHALDAEVARLLDGVTPPRGAAEAWAQALHPYVALCAERGTPAVAADELTLLRALSGAAMRLTEDPTRDDAEMRALRDAVRAVHHEAGEPDPFAAYPRAQGLWLGALKRAAKERPARPLTDADWAAATNVTRRIAGGPEAT